MQQGGTGLPGEHRAISVGSDIYDLIHDLDAIIWELDVARRQFTFVSQRAEELLGYPIERWLGEPGFWANQVVHPDDRGWVVERCLHIGNTGAVHQLEYRALTASGEVLWLRHFSRAVPRASGGANRRGVIFDITEQKQTEEALRRQRAYFARLFENAPEAIVLLDDTDRVQRVNEEFSRLFGYPAEAALGRMIAELIVPEGFLEEASSLSRRAAAGERVGIETVRRRRDGTLVHVSILAVPVEFEDGTRRVYGIYRDVSARKGAEQALAESEEQLRQAQRMEAVGRLAGGVAHDFNNLLTVIQGHAQLLLDGLGVADPRREDAEEVWRSAKRAAALTRQLLAFSRKQILKPESVELNVIVARMERMLRRLIGEEIHFELRLSSDLGRVLADPGQLEQVIMNLVVNARDAMPGGGLLSISTANMELDEEYATAFPYPVQPGPYVLLTVRDTGIGMSPEVRERIFEPFFTTMELGQGRGLGLSTVFGIVKQSGGYIWVESEEGAGTTVRLCLPRVAGGVQQAEPERDGGCGEGRGDTEAVLVVEDEDAVRSLICKVLRRQGYTVLEAANGGSALLQLETHPGSIHLVITDMVMPGMSGTELADRVAEIRPGLPFLFISGYTEDELVRRGVADGRLVLLEKPFSPAALSRRVREMLARVPRP
jgi:PAS domain S-box-containing protein